MNIEYITQSVSENTGFSTRGCVGFGIVPVTGLYKQVIKGEIAYIDTRTGS